MKGRIKKIKINGVKATVIVPPTIKKMPKELKSKQNHPKGLFVEED